ncbi:MAG: two-component system response regulator [Actinomycetaceae bacterium]|nr:two-component system response regulator [Actinomycetaceae bacterium]MDY6143539.1 two-component system response regulator [Arcanobacterium sp.]
MVERPVENMEGNMAAEAGTQTSTVKILVYSDNRETRDEVIHALGRRIGREGRAIEYVESATWEGADLKVRENDFDLLILDAETRRMGGIGLGKRVRDEIDEDMPYIVLIARPQDEWLARVSKPNAILQYPVDGRELSAAVKDILAAK